MCTCTPFLFLSLSLSLSPIMSSANGPHHGGRIREIDVPLFAALATASGRNSESARQLAKLACPLLTRLVLKHNLIAEVRERERERDSTVNDMLWLKVCVID